MGHLVERFDGVHGQTNRPAVVGDRASDGLTNPPGRIGGELEAAPELEAVHGFHQPDVAFLDQIEQREPASEVALRDRDDETQVRLDQLALRLHEEFLALPHLGKPLTELTA